MTWLRIMDNDLHELAVNLDMVTMIDEWKDEEHTRIWLCGDAQPCIVALPYHETLKAIQNIGRNNE